MKAIKVTGEWDGEKIWREKTAEETLSSFLPKEYVIPKDEPKYEMPRKLKAWIADKKGQDVDYSINDFGVPEK